MVGLASTHLLACGVDGFSLSAERMEADGDEFGMDRFRRYPYLHGRADLVVLGHARRHRALILPRMYLND